MARMYQRYSDELLAVGKTVAAAARAAGISERTAYRRKKHPAVRARIAEVRRAALDTASGQLHQGMVSACDTLTGLFGHANPHVQIRAAQTVIQLALKVRQAVDVADQLDRIEQPTRPAILDSGQDPADRSDALRRPQLSTPDDPAGPTIGPAPSDAGIERATGGDDRDGGVGFAPPLAPEHSGETPGLAQRPRPNLTARMAAMVCVLLLLAGLPCASAGPTRARVERGPAADGRLPTCQNLTGPATRPMMPRPAGQNRLVGRNCGRGGAYVGRVFDTARP